jgi:hypothetical protein
MRVVAATARLVDVLGPSAVSVDSIARLASVEQHVIRELFVDERGCLTASFRKAAAVAAEHSIPWYAAQNGALPRVRTAVTRMLTFCEREPEMASVLLLGGPDLSDCRARMLLTLTGLLANELVRVSERPPPEIDDYVTVVAAAVEIVAASLCTPAPESRGDLAREVLELILTPYLGAGGARREACQLELRLQRTVRLGAPRPSLELRLTAELLSELVDAEPSAVAIDDRNVTRELTAVVPSPAACV